MARPWDVVSYYINSWPFELRRDQIEDVNELAPWPRVALFNAPGVGKTATATAIVQCWGLEDLIDQVLLIMPPILIPQWSEWLSSFGEDYSITEYRGTPAQREKLDLEADFVLMSIQIFKNDHEKLMKHFRPKRVAIVIDEAAMVRQPDTENYRATRDLLETEGKRLILMTGTPCGAHPATAYGYIALKSPTIYTSHRQFMLIHVTGTDKYRSPNKFQNLDMLHGNLMYHAAYRLAEDVLELPETTYIPVKYDLSAKHQRLYNTLVEEKLVEFANGEVIDALSEQRLYAACQQLVINVPDETIRPAGFDVLDQVIEETGLMRGEDEKLIIYCNFRKSNEAVAAYLDAKKITHVLVYGGGDNQKAVEKFQQDQNCKILVANPKSGGVGLNLQVARYQLYLEIPITSSDFQQAVARVKRCGQERKIVIWIACAKGTIQVKLQTNILKKEAIVQQVTPTVVTLRAALLGKN